MPGGGRAGEARRGGPVFEEGRRGREGGRREGGRRAWPKEAGRGGNVLRGGAEHEGRKAAEEHGDAATAEAPAVAEAEEERRSETKGAGEKQDIRVFRKEVEEE